MTERNWQATARTVWGFIQRRMHENRSPAKIQADMEQIRTLEAEKRVLLEEQVKTEEQKLKLADIEAKIKRLQNPPAPPPAPPRTPFWR